ncbi:hypothetical protein FISHEDRAFT_61878 [Fistulina hepatica ATCC 64428]|uniref:C2H2-type domain-containing protein n=1 Tax=Fistulina hepatica ATCC 64428 TaxID=1128425 RepID=A0A0D7A1V1_9AGAR|nr:hypothetical protein FISHEDRAFT_61878 [Fistulina hepatica ATCC 64428]
MRACFLPFLVFPSCLVEHSSSSCPVCRAKYRPDHGVKKIHISFPHELPVIESTESQKRQLALIGRLLASYKEPRDSVVIIQIIRDMNALLLTCHKEQTVTLQHAKKWLIAHHKSVDSERRAYKTRIQDLQETIHCRDTKIREYDIAFERMKAFQEALTQCNADLKRQIEQLEIEKDALKAEIKVRQNDHNPLPRPPEPVDLEQLGFLGDEILSFTSREDADGVSRRSLQGLSARIDRQQMPQIQSARDMSMPHHASKDYFGSNDFLASEAYIAAFKSAEAEGRAYASGERTTVPPSSFRDDDVPRPPLRDEAVVSPGCATASVTGTDADFYNQVDDLQPELCSPHLSDANSSWSAPTVSDLSALSGLYFLPQFPRASLPLTEVADSAQAHVSPLVDSPTSHSRPLGISLINVEGPPLVEVTARIRISPPTHMSGISRDGEQPAHERQQFFLSQAWRRGIEAVKGSRVGGKGEEIIIECVVPGRNLVHTRQN